MRASLVRHWCLGTVLVLLSSCAIKVNVPVNRFDSPETIGKQWRVKVDAALGGSDDVVLTPDATIRGPNSTSPSLERGRFFRVGGGVALLDNLDVELRNFSTLAAKFQFLGDPRFTAQAGNFALAVTVAGGFDTESSTGSGALSNQSYSMSKDEFFVDTAMVAGFRPLDWFLIYTGPFIRQTSYSGKYASGPSPETIGVSSAFSGSVFAYGAEMGFEFGTPLFQIRVEGAYGQVKSGALNSGQSYVGSELAFNFGKH